MERTIFDRLNQETKDYNNGFNGRRIGWYDATQIYQNGTKRNAYNQKGHYDGRGVWVKD